MKPNDLARWASMLYEAKAEPIGLAVRCNDPQRLRVKLYEARRCLGDPELSNLQFRLLALAPDELWITKSDIYMPREGIE